jgi:hypothetical protein
MRFIRPIRTVAGFLTLVVAFFGFAGGTSAAPMTLDDCDDQGCQGVTLSLEVTESGGTYHVTYTINADGYTGDRLGLNQVGFKTISNWKSVTLDSSPASSAVPWTNPVEAVNSSNNLCEKGTSSDKVCTSGFVDITGGGDYTWEFTLTGSTLLDPIDWHFGGQFADAPGTARGEIISAAIPEPSAALVFSLGLLVVGRHLGIRKRKAL